MRALKIISKQGYLNKAENKNKGRIQKTFQLIEGALQFYKHVVIYKYSSQEEPEPKVIKQAVML